MRLNGKKVYLDYDCPKDKVYFLLSPSVYINGELIGLEFEYPHFKMHPDRVSDYNVVFEDGD